MSEQVKQKPQSGNLLGTAFFMLVGAMIISEYLQELSFYFNTTTYDVKSVEAIKHINANTDVRVYLPLAKTQAIAVSYASQREFVLTPFEGAGLSLIFISEGPVISNQIPEEQSVTIGRAVKADIADSWQVNGKPLKLKQIYQKQGLTIPDNAVVLYQAEKQPPSLWLSFVALLSLLYILWQFKNLFQFLHSLVNANNDSKH